MDNNELKEALMSGRPVEHNGITYKCVSGIIYRRRASGEIFLEAELMDRNQNSVTICEPSRVHYKEV
jgi:hypothetical protein